MTDFTEIGQRITDMTKMDVPSGLLNKIKKLPELSKMTASFPKAETSDQLQKLHQLMHHLMIYQF